MGPGPHDRAVLLHEESPVLQVAVVATDELEEEIELEDTNEMADVLGEIISVDDKLLAGESKAAPAER